MNDDGVLGRVMTLNGDPWVVVDVAPAEPLAEMVANLLEEEGIVTTIRGDDSVGDVFTHLGAQRAGVALVLVPQGDAERALEIVRETVTDYQGEDLDALLAELKEEGVDPAEVGLPSDAEDDDPGT